jgi:hypothetical protein
MNCRSDAHIRTAPSVGSGDSRPAPTGMSRAAETSRVVAVPQRRGLHRPVEPAAVVVGVAGHDTGGSCRVQSTPVTPTRWICASSPHGACSADVICSTSVGLTSMLHARPRRRRQGTGDDRPPVVHDLRLLPLRRRRGSDRTIARVCTSAGRVVMRPALVCVGVTLDCAWFLRPCGALLP